MKLMQLLNGPLEKQQISWEIFRAFPSLIMENSYRYELSLISRSFILRGIGSENFDEIFIGFKLNSVHFKAPTIH